MELYTDGAYSSKTKIGGWAVVSKDSNNNTKLIKNGSDKSTTSNRMELTALLVALETIQNSEDINNSIHTDSAYISNCFKDKWYVKWQQNGWKNATNEPVKNDDLWKAIFKLYENFAEKPQILKVAGHTGDIGNEQADFYATSAREL